MRNMLRFRHVGFVPEFVSLSESLAPQHRVFWGHHHSDERSTDKLANQVGEPDSGVPDEEETAGSNGVSHLSEGERISIRKLTSGGPSYWKTMWQLLSTNSKRSGMLPQNTLVIL
jgi:hypothetical protein